MKIKVLLVAQIIGLAVINIWTYSVLSNRIWILEEVAAGELATAYVAEADIEEGQKRLESHINCHAK